MPELALLVGKKRLEFSSDRQSEGFLKLQSKSNRKHSLLTVWSKTECRGSIWRLAWREGGANRSKSAHDEPPLLPEPDRGWRGADKEGGKQVESKRQIKSASDGSVYHSGRRGEEVRGMRADHEQGQDDTVWRNRK